MAENPRRVSLSANAQTDVDDIWWYTAGTYGEEQADRYVDLLEQAVSDLDQDPYRRGSKPRPGIGQTFRSYHVALSAPHSGTGIKKPRHVVIYFEVSDDAFVVSRILHDAMDLARHIPEGHLQGEE